MFAEQYGWDQQQVEAMDPDYRTELSAFLSAKGAIQHKYRAKKKVRSHAQSGRA